MAAIKATPAERNASKQSDNMAVALAVIQNDISYIKESLDEIKTSTEKKYVTKEDFDPVKRIVYGLVALILVGVVGALLALVIIK